MLLEARLARRTMLRLEALDASTERAATSLGRGGRAIRFFPALHAEAAIAKLRRHAENHLAVAVRILEALHADPAVEVTEGREEGVRARDGRGTTDEARVRDGVALVGRETTIDVIAATALVRDRIAVRRAGHREAVRI